MDFTKQLLQKHLSIDESVELYNSGWWKQITMQRAAFLQLHQEKICMPWEVFHDYLEILLERPIFTHKFADFDKLKKESYTRGSKYPGLADLIATQKQCS